MRLTAIQKWLIAFIGIILIYGCKSKIEYQNFTLMNHDQVFITLKQLRLTQDSALRPNPPDSKVPPNLTNGDVFFEYTGVFFAACELQVANQHVLRNPQKTQWEKTDNRIPGGLYDWYVGDSGIFLLKDSQGLLVNFQAALKTTPGNRQKTVFSIPQGQPDTLIISLGNQEIALKSRVVKMENAPFQLPEPSPAVIEGKAFWKDKKTPLKWVSLELQQYSSNVGKTTPDENGDFRFTGVHPGKYMLYGRRGDKGNWCPLTKTAEMEALQVLGGVVSVGTVYTAGWCDE